jgi:hypothetical protein
MIRLVLRATALLSTLPAAGRGQVPCLPGSGCDFASAIVGGVLAGISLQGRTLFVDPESFARVGAFFAAPVALEQVVQKIDRTFRTDVSAAALTTPGPGYNPRWGNDPYVIIIDSVTGTPQRATAFVELRWNVRQDNPRATAVTAYSVKGAYVLERKPDGWAVVERRRVGEGQ